jgi:hypothetical protein
VNPVDSKFILAVIRERFPEVEGNPQNENSEMPKNYFSAGYLTAFRLGITIKQKQTNKVY